jgi:hypothetical protein
MTDRLINNLTVDELKIVIADVIDDRLNNFSKLNEVTVKSKQENPWLKMAGMHDDNPLLEEVVAYIEESRKEIWDKELD